MAKIKIILHMTNQHLNNNRFRIQNQFQNGGHKFQVADWCKLTDSQLRRPLDPDISMEFTIKS
jgi:hypothetical protein